MKICVLICGLERSLDLVIKNIEEKFNNYHIDFIINIDINLNSKEIIKNILINNKTTNIIKYIFTKDIDNSYRNSLNYSNKICDSIKLIPNINYFLYLIVRTDLIINNINIQQLDNDKLYFSNKNINQFTKNIKNKLNDNIILTKNIELLRSLISLHNFNLNNTNYLDIVLYEYLNKNNIKYDYFDVQYKLILCKCNIIAIAGDSGSGKTTLMRALEPLFGENSTLKLETDRYHKWERGDKNYNTYTHLHPEANHLEKMYEDVYDLKIGNDIYQIDYDHSSGKFTQKEKIDSKDNLILCGLHTIYDNKIKEILDIKIFVDTDRELIKKWKIQRDVVERGYTLEKVLNQIEAREKDYEEFISIQKNSSDIIINFYQDISNNIQCNFIVLNKKIIEIIIGEIIRLNYELLIDNNKLIIKLKNEIECDNNIVNTIFNLNENLFKSTYFKEIFYILFFYNNLHNI